MHIERFEQPELVALIEAIGQFFEDFDLRRNVGRVWAVLYLACEPVDQSHLGTILCLSAGLISSSLKELEHWGAVRRVTKRGERRFFYEAEERLLRIVATILAKRELHAVQTLREAMINAHNASPKIPFTRAMKRRIRAIELISELYEVLTALVARASSISGASLHGLVRTLRGKRLLQSVGE